MTTESRQDFILTSVNDTRMKNHEDQEPDFSELSDDHIPSLLDEAKQCYLNSSDHPDFLQGKSSRAAPGTRIVVRPAINGKPDRDREVNVVSRSWDEKSCYWTLDMNGERLIVKKLSGGSGGSTYKEWGGQELGFKQEAIAFAQVRKSARTHIDDKLSSSQGDDEDFKAYTHPPLRHTVQKIEGVLTKNDNREQSFTGLISSDLQSRIATRATAGPALESNLPSASKIKKAARDMHLNGSRSSFMSNNIAQKIYRDIAQRSRKISLYNDLSGVRLKPSNIQPMKRSVSRASSPESSSKLDPVSLQSSKRQKSRTSMYQTVEASPFEDNHSPQPSTDSSNFDRKGVNISVFFPPLDYFIPIKINKGMTHALFFALVLGAFHLEKRKEDVNALIVTISSLVDGDPARFGVLREDQGTFDFFLERLHQLPSFEKWECPVKVEITMKT